MAAPSVLHHTRVVADGADPHRWLLVLHGIYGAGRNWGHVARRFVSERPGWGAVLVDLREHGGSVGRPPPHDLESCASDLRELVEAEELDARAVLGHSFGGKVALVYARDPAVPLAHVWVVDSTPDTGSPGGSAWEMLDVLRRNPGPFAGRSEGVEALVAGGVAEPVARWMATNLEDEGGAWGWRIDPGVMETLLRDFYRTDAWDVVESPPPGARIHVIQATDSSVLTPEAADRVSSGGGGRAHLHRVEGGHWLNADNPEALVELLVREM